MYTLLFIGKFIPASQRPDGTWRKARRVKDGYIPQEEVPLYESKGKKFTKKPDIPVGMCPIMAEEARVKREKLLKQQLKQQQRQNTPGIISLSHNKTSKEKKNTKSEPKQGSSASTHNDSNVMRLCDGVANINLSTPDDLQKQLKKLKKKIREIEAIEDKLKSGDLKTPEQDQLDKVSRKSDILLHIEEVEGKLKSMGLI